MGAEPCARAAERKELRKRRPAERTIFLAGDMIKGLLLKYNNSGVSGPPAHLFIDGSM